MCGSDARHGGHQVAQKSTNTTFPFKSESFTSLPSVVLRAKFGAALPLRDSGPAPASLAADTARGPIPASNPRAISPSSQRRGRDQKRRFIMHLSGKVRPEQYCSPCTLGDDQGGPI